MSDVTTAPVTVEKLCAEAQARERALKALISDGLTFSQCIGAFGVDVDENPFASAARADWHRDGEIEIDDTVVVSEGCDQGAYVMAWVWVDETSAIKHGFLPEEIIEADVPADFLRFKGWSINGDDEISLPSSAHEITKDEQRALDHLVLEFDYHFEPVPKR